MIVVADTSGVIAASDRNARESAACQGVLREAGTVIISPLVLTEVDHLAKARFGSRARTTIIDFILAQARQLRLAEEATSCEVDLSHMREEEFKAALLAKFGRYEEMPLAARNHKSMNREDWESLYRDHCLPPK